MTGQCKECEKKRRIHSRGLCRACWTNPSIRAQHGIAAKAMPSYCLECGKNPPHGGRGLCSGCYKRDDIRARYPTLGKGGRRPEPELDLSLLKKPRPDRCLHGIKDGLCSVCERLERMAVAIEAEVKEEHCA